MSALFGPRMFQSFLALGRTAERGGWSVTAPDGRTFAHAGAEPGATAVLRINDWGVLPAISRRGDLGFAETYRDGRWTTDDLVAVIRFACDNEAALRRVLSGSWVQRAVSNLAYALRANTRRGSRRNIHAHYDLGSDFFSLWLDPSMTYSSALFAHDDQPLEAAQHNKHDAVLARLGSRPGDVLDIGCGWGSFIERALDRAGHRVTGVTISPAQWTYARSRLAGKEEQAAVHLRDYRDLDGRFDSIVSVEMFEAVGERYWPTYFAKIAALLRRGGRAVIQTITVKDADFPRYRRGIDVFRSFIFPGGMLASPSRIAALAADAELKMTDGLSFGPDYAKTATHWLSAFDTARDRIAGLGFDEKFIALWRFYLATCVAAFAARKIDVMHIELRHA